MIALLQRVSSASVQVDNKMIGRINQGVLVLLGVQKNDDTEKAKRLAERTLNYRIFSDQQDKMNLSVRDISGQVLVVPQFTLAANTRKGNRPSFQDAAPPQVGKALYECYCDHIRQANIDLATGSFGADMKVQLTNDGPVTFWLEV